MKTTVPRTWPELLRALSAWEPAPFIFGGWAEDALLYGRQSRAHEDVDVMVLRDELDRRLEQAREIGFEHWHLRFAVFEGKPSVIGSRRDGLDLEIVVFERDEEGRVYWEMPTPQGLARLYVPDDAFDTPPAKVDGVEVRTVSPRMLYQLRIGVAELFGGMRPKDVVSQRALRERFFRGVPEKDLAPRVTLVDHVPFA